VGINTGKVKAALGATPLPANPWDLIFKPEYASKLKGCGINLLDSASEVLPVAMIYAGKEPYSKVAKDYDAAREVLKAAPLRDAVFVVGLHQRSGQRASCAW
jgi:putrescine transport system substrate-binding protein